MSLLAEETLSAAAVEELIDHLEDLTVDVDGKQGNTTKVRVFCE